LRTYQHIVWREPVRDGLFLPITAPAVGYLTHCENLGY
jgi:hypothetical protein